MIHLTHEYRLCVQDLQTSIKKTLDENQSREQAGFWKGYSTPDNLQAVDQIIENSVEYNLPLCIGFIDYEKAFDTVEHFAIFVTLRKISIMKHVKMYYKFSIDREVRQEDQISHHRFTAAMNEIFNIRRQISLDESVFYDVALMKKNQTNKQRKRKNTWQTTQTVKIY